MNSKWRSNLTDYIGSGYDRGTIKLTSGHMAAAGNVHSTQAALDETFLLTNISPQIAIGFNRGYWAHFESFVRSLTNTFDHVQVITGPLFLPNHIEEDSNFIKIRVLGNPPNTQVRIITRLQTI